MPFFLKLSHSHRTTESGLRLKPITADRGRLGAVMLLVSAWLWCLPAQALTEAEQQGTNSEAASVSAEPVASNQEIEQQPVDSDKPDIAEIPGAVNVPTAGNITDKDTVIATKPDQVNDQDIKQRISGIYSEIEGLKALSVTVSQGVVSISGEVPNEKKAQQAISLANRVSDVVAVEDRISRTLDVQDNVTPVISSLNQQIRAFIQALPLLVVAILVFAAVVWFGSWLARRESLWQRITPNPFIAELLAQTVKVLFFIIALLLGLSLMGAEAIIGTLLGGAGVIGIAVGFAVKDTIENYIASLMLSIRQPFQARDLVSINGQQGIVVRLTSRATILMTSDGNQLRLPNSEVFKGTILNYTKNPERRFTFQLGVDANDDPLAAIKVGLEAVNSLDFVLDNPKAVCIITEVGDSNIMLEFQVWVDQTDTDIMKARSIAIREAKHALEDHGFSLPEPIYRLRFNQDVEHAIMQLHSALSGESAESTEYDNSFVANNPKLIEALSKQIAALNNQAKPDTVQKEQAKQRAKQILGDKAVKEIFDAKPDPKLMQKVEEEIQDHSGDKDLLDGNSPQE